MLEEMKKTDSFWRLYWDVLPNDLSNFPLYFNEEERKMCDGSQIKEKVVNFLGFINRDYKLVCKNVPEFKEYEEKSYY